MLPYKFFSDTLQPMCLRKIYQIRAAFQKKTILAHRRSEGTESTFFYINIELLKVFEETMFSLKTDDVYLLLLHNNFEFSNRRDGA
jgi:hypothetical protein